MERVRVWWKAAAPLVCCLALGACESDPTGLPARVEQYVFLTQPHDLNAYPDALFEGVVTVDAAGCIRLTGPEPDNSTVVWPAGSTIEGATHAPTVRDRHGTVIGVIGGTFRFGGGHTSNLAVIAGLTEAEAGEVLGRCPGNFWLVAP
jgi:hypothetical protein